MNQKHSHMDALSEVLFTLTPRSLDQELSQLTGNRTEDFLRWIIYLFNLFDTPEAPNESARKLVGGLLCLILLTYVVNKYSSNLFRRSVNQLLSIVSQAKSIQSLAVLP